MDSFKEVKDWLFNKIQSVVTNSGNDVTQPRTMGPITPGNIPEFVIPASNESSRRTSECSADSDSWLKRNSVQSLNARRFSPPASLVHISPSDSTTYASNNRLESCHSAPVTPKHDCRDIASCRNTHSSALLDSMAGATNVDQLSFAAMSLPHFRTQTSYGMSTCPERPHTRRKESLFHMGNEGLLPRNNALHISNENCYTRFYDHLTPESAVLSVSAPNGLGPPGSNTPSVIVTSFTQSTRQCSSPELMPCDYIANRRLSPTYQAFHNMNSKHFPSRHNRVYNRRRSSLVWTPNTNDGENSSGQSSATGSSNGSPVLRKRSFGDLMVPSTSTGALKRHSDPQIPFNRLGDENQSQKPRSRSFHVISKNEQAANRQQVDAPFGELKFSFQYLPASRQLKLRLLKAENLGGQSKSDQTVNSFAKAYLLPGKIQKQCSDVVKRTKNPVYNQDVYFQSLRLDSLHNMTLRIKIESKGHNLKMTEFLGEVTIPLDGYDLLAENRIWKDLESRKDREERGFLDVGLLFEPHKELLHVQVNQARSLPQHPLTGPPDVYVRVEVTQPARQTSSKQTTLRRKTTDPIFDEILTFTISSKVDDLFYTVVSVFVFNRNGIRSDDVIGHVDFGRAATESSQFEHWEEAIGNPGELTSKWHYLMEHDL